MRQKLRTKLPSLRLIMGVAFGSLVLVLVLVLSLVTGRISTRKIQQNAKESLALLAAYMADELDRNMYERYREIALMASTNATLRDLQLPLVQKRAVLEQLQESYADYTWIGLTDAQGTVVVATGGLLEGENVSTQPWYAAALAGPQVSAANSVVLMAEMPHIAVGSFPRSQPFVDIAAPVFDEEGLLVGVLNAHLSWGWLQEVERALLRPLATVQQVEMYVVGEDERILLGPVRAGKASPGDSGNEQVGTSIEDWNDSAEYVTGYAYSRGYRGYPGLNWLVLARQPTATAFAEARRTQLQILGVGIVFAAIFAWVAWLLAGYIARPLLIIAAAAERIGRNEPGATIPVLRGSAEVTALSTSLNQLVADLTTAATAERNRIARDLHDSVTQTLFSSSMIADVLPRVWETNPERGREKLEELRRAVRGALAEMRTLLLELRPHTLEDAEVQQLLRQLAEATSGRAGVEVTWSVDGDCAGGVRATGRGEDAGMPADIKVALYRTVQEALNNVAKHADATHAHIELRCELPRIELTVEDDGRGFEPETVSSEHLGVSIMRERVENTGGIFSLRTAPGAGTIIHAIWQRSHSDDITSPDATTTHA